MALSAELVCVLAVLLGAVWLVVRRYVAASPLDRVPGPTRSSAVLGNLEEFFSRDGCAFQDRIAEAYGPVVKINGLLGEKMLYVYDPKAMHSIFVKDQHAYDQPGWFFVSNQLIFGPGLTATAGERHKRQRKMLNPIFSIQRMRHLTPVFYEVAHRLRRALTSQLNGSKQEIDVLHWLNRTALELVGQASFGYSFDSLLEEKPNAFGDAIKALAPSLSKLSVLRLLVEHFARLGPPQFRRRLAELVPQADFRQLKSVIDTMDARSREIFRERKDAIGCGDAKAVQQLSEARDILSIMLKANLAASEEERLPGEELIAQMSLFAFAGTDTTASVMARMLHLLAIHPDVQQKLRKEVTDARHGQDLPYDELMALPYLDAIIRETLRLCPPATTSFRDTLEDVVMPLSEPIQGADGLELAEIMVPKGTTIVVGIRGSNTNKAIWGDDALEWKPERWLGSQPQSLLDAKIPGVYTNLMTFVAGARSCVGFKMSEIEMKVALSVLVENFKFTTTGRDIFWNMAFVSYPTVDRESVKATLPLNVEQIIN